MGWCARLITAVGVLAAVTLVSCRRGDDSSEGMESDQERTGTRGSVAVPEGWTSEPRKVKVATPEGLKEKEITYYRNSIGMEFVLVAAGEFMMGSRDSAEEVTRKANAEENRFRDEHPQHRVRVNRPFYMGATEVTQGQYRKVIGDHLFWFKDGENPVDTVSWDDAAEFCKKLSQHEGRTYRLPTEAEWEYACRAGTTTPFYTGETISTDLANYDGNYVYDNGHRGEYRKKTTPVASFPANPWGLYDMHGNVLEWCADWHSADHYAKSPRDDLQGASTGELRVYRGGSWDLPPHCCRSALRGKARPTLNGFPFLGFRVVCEAP